MADGVSPEQDSPQYQLPDDLCDAIDWAPVEDVSGVGVLIKHQWDLNTFPVGGDAVTCGGWTPDHVVLAGSSTFVYGNVDDAVTGFSHLTGDLASRSLVEPDADLDSWQDVLIVESTGEILGSYGVQTFVRSGNLVIGASVSWTGADTIRSDETGMAEVMTALTAVLSSIQTHAAA